MPRRKRRRRLPNRPLTVKQILTWADNHFAHTGQWPRCTDDYVLDDFDERWRNLDAALRAGCRGLPGGSSLPQLLAEHRGVRNIGGLPPLTEDGIAAWAQEFYDRKWDWPLCTNSDGPPGETWTNLDAALRLGLRGLPGGSSLPKLLAERFGVRNPSDLPSFTEEQILVWVDEHHDRTGVWPKLDDGPVHGVFGESWLAVDKALREGLRGLPGGSSLARLLQDRRGVRNIGDLTDLTEDRILDWVKAHRRRTGAWPCVKSGPVAGAAGETWLAVESALREGLRGLPGGSSLAQLLNEKLGVRNKAKALRLTVDHILIWAEAYHGRTGRWPEQASGPIPESPGETWSAVDTALRDGGRGLPGGSSLLLLLAKRRGVRNAKRPPRLTVRQIGTWASAHRQRTGKWPSQNSGAVTGAPGETWSGVNAALRVGLRGLPGDDSLARLVRRRASQGCRKV